MGDFEKGLIITVFLVALAVGMGAVGPAWGQESSTALVISEFMASNERSLRDSYNDYPDWIEIQNLSNEPIDLDGWFLTDDPNELDKWEFPSVQIASGGYLVVFASGRNERDPEAELHTNFGLQAKGESVVLVRPDGTIAHAYIDYRPQFADISYGLGTEGAGPLNERVLVSEGATAKAWIPPDGSLGLAWTEPGFDDRAWPSGTTGVGYDYAGLIGLDVGAMYGINQSVYVRIPFEVSDAAAVDRLTLRMKFEDGFVAYLNGFEVARANAPDEVSWNSGATTTHDDFDAVIFYDFNITDAKDWLIQGQNVLAIHGLNAGLTSSDLLVLPELVATTVDEIDLTGIFEGYFLEPTPGEVNREVLAQIGPAIRNVTENPPPPAADEDLVITTELAETQAPILGAQLAWLINFDDASGDTFMVDDGTGGDAVAGDGIYTAVIPASAYGPGDMVRWSVVAVDTNAQMTYAPLFLYPNDSPEYFGTIVQDPAVDTALPVLYWFVENVGLSETRSGTPCSVYYLGQFYDNVRVHIRGGSTAGAPKKHFKFNFNHGYKFQYREGVPRVNEFNLNSTYSDKAYFRQSLAFEAYDWCGNPGSESFPVRAQRNGQFYGVQIFIEEPEEELLQREGLDPDGALYKMYNTFNAGGSAEKKTRRWEGRQDLDDFCRAINNTSGTTLHNNIFDWVDLPRTLDYLVATILTHQNDHPHKNHYLYCDSDGSGQWFFMPWDHDLTWGSNWTGSSYHDYIYAADDRVPGKPSSVKPSHPFVGKQDCQEWNYHWNQLTDALLNDATVRMMFLRRLRTVMDEFLGAPGTPYSELFIENHIDDLAAMMAGDVALDYAKWADPWTWGGQGGYTRDQSFQYAIDVIKNDYLAVRRRHLFVTHNVDNVAHYNITGSYSAEIPNAQPSDAAVMLGDCDFNPISGNQDEEYLELFNPNIYAVDISGWQLTGGIEHTFLPGTVVAPWGTLYVTPNAWAFRNRAITPTGGQGLYFQGNYQGHLSSWGETIDLVDHTGRLVGSLTYEGDPSQTQRYLRVTEIMYHPAEGQTFDADEYEFIELTNIGVAPLLLDAVKLTDGISYVFESGRNVYLSGGASIVIVKNREAFAQRYGLGGINLAQGVYTGSLNNGGERIKLEDQTNSTILSFEYNDNWYPETDGQGSSLVIVDSTNADLNTWDTSNAWQPSPEPGGSPGTD